MTAIFRNMADFARQFRAVLAAGFEGESQPSSDAARWGSDLDALWGDLHF